MLSLLRHSVDTSGDSFRRCHHCNKRRHLAQFSETERAKIGEPSRYIVCRFCQPITQAVPVTPVLPSVALLADAIQMGQRIGRQQQHIRKQWERRVAANAA